MAFVVLRGLLLLVGLLVWSGVVSAQDFPTKPVKLIVPFPAGGPADTFARVLGDKMGALLGQPVVIETRAGAGGLTGRARRLHRRHRRLERAGDQRQFAGEHAVSTAQGFPADHAGGVGPGNSGGR
jgi:hypothetical protein